MNDIFNEDFGDGYYHIGKDIESHPECTIFIVWSPRGPGKTYSGLRYPYRKSFPIIYMKRTVEDVNFICDYSGEDDFDPSLKRIRNSPSISEIAFSRSAKSTPMPRSLP